MQRSQEKVIAEWLTTAFSKDRRQNTKKCTKLRYLEKVS